VGDALALDAGALTEALTLDEQSRLDAVLLTHAHLDHTASLPFLVENVFGRASRPVEIVAPADVLSALKAHLFNDAIWPDFSRLPDHQEPTVTFRTLVPGVPAPVGGITVTPIPVTHVVPAYGYLLDEGAVSVVFSGDTGPTQAVWATARAARHLRAAFVECSFPDELAAVADASKHLTPATLRAEVAKLPAGIPVFLYHMKPPGLDSLARQVAALGDPRIRLLRDGEELVF
jgi:ribonuclease BN (tRNA processing enzyme)